MLNLIRGMAKFHPDTSLEFNKFTDWEPCSLPNTKVNKSIALSYMKDYESGQVSDLSMFVGLSNEEMSHVSKNPMKFLGQLDKLVTDLEMN